MLKFLVILIVVFVNLYAQNGLESHRDFDLIFFGAFSMIIIYNFTYIITLKSATYTSYFMFHMTLLIVMLFYTGTLEEPWFDFNIHNIPIGIFFLSIAMLLAFSRDFLDLNVLHPAVEKFTNKLIILNLLLVFLSAYSITNTRLEIISISLLIFESIGFLTLSAYLTIKKHSIYALFYLLSFSFLFIIFLFASLDYFNLIHLEWNITYLLELAILVEASGLSFALAYKQKELEINLRQKQLLFQELSHRIQNNLQQIISILTMHINDTQDANVKLSLENTINRIHTVSLIHKTLQNSSNVGKVNIHTYLNALIDKYTKLYPHVTFTYECSEKLEMTIDKLTPLALILNELITNSVKHAFKDVDNAQIHITIIQDKMFHFTFKDNGRGFKKTAVTHSIGTKLINILSKSQLKGEVSVASDKNYFFSLKFSR